MFPSVKCGLEIPSHSLIFCFLQNVFNMVVEVPRWTNAKMEVTILQFLAQVLELTSLLIFGFADSLLLSSTS